MLEEVGKVIQVSGKEDNYGLGQRLRTRLHVASQCRHFFPFLIET